MCHVPKKPLYQTIDGIRFPSLFSPKCIRETLEYKPRSDDVFIVTYPKCGTTWMQNVLIYIFRKGRELSNPTDFFQLSPFMDMFGLESVANMPRPGAIKTHLPYTRMPYSRDAKYLFVARNPRDCCVSLYNHTKMIPGFDYADGEFDDFFELFLSGEVEYGDYFDHLLSWYPHRNDCQLFYTTYENMKKDLRDVVLRVARFLGPEHVETIEKDNAVLRNILHFSSFDYMKKTISRAFSWFNMEEAKVEAMPPGLAEGVTHIRNFVLSLDLPKDRPKMNFIRKGIVGDWKNYFSDEQRERLEKKFDEKTKGTEIQNWFK